MSTKKTYMVWDKDRRKAKKLNHKMLQDFPNWRDMIRDIEETGRHKGEYITITEYEVKQ